MALSGTKLSNFPLALFPHDGSSSGRMHLGASWGLGGAPGGGAGFCTPPAEPLQATGVSVLQADPAEDSPVSMLLVDEFTEAGRDTTFFGGQQLHTVAPATPYPSTQIVTPGSTIRSAVFDRWSPVKPDARVGLHLKRSDPFTPPPLANEYDDISGETVHEGTAFGIWGSRAGHLAVGDQLDSRTGPKVDIGIEPFSTEQLEIFAVGFRSGWARRDTLTELAIWDATAGAALDTFTADGDRFALLLDTPILYAGNCISLECSNISGDAPRDVVAVIWIREQGVPTPLDEFWTTSDPWWTTDEMWT